MTDIQIDDIPATTEPFRLDVGPHVVVLSGTFEGAVATLHRQRRDDLNTFDPVTEIAPFTKPDVQQWRVEVNAIGFYRLHVDPASKAPSLTLIVSPGAP